MIGISRPDQRQHQGLADQVRVALVLRVHGHGDVAEHGFRARGGDGHGLVAAGDRVADRPHVAVALDVVDLQVGHRGAQRRIPVDQAVAAVDQAGAVPLDEHLAHRGRQARVHGEALARPVRGHAEAAHLVGDGRAGLFLPLPHALDKGLAAQRVLVGVLGRQLVLDDLLRGDAGVVAADLPQRVVAAHAVVAHQHVHHRLLEGMAHVQGTGDVGRRQQDAVGVAVAARLEAAVGFPAGIPLGFDLGGFETLVHGQARASARRAARRNREKSVIVRGWERRPKHGRLGWRHWDFRASHVDHDVIEAYGHGRFVA